VGLAQKKMNHLQTLVLEKKLALARRLRYYEAGIDSAT
jgi:hypothetical protein